MFWRREEPTIFDKAQNKTLKILSQNDKTFHAWLQNHEKWIQFLQTQNRALQSQINNLQTHIQNLEAAITALKARDEKFAKAIQTLGSLSTESEQAEKHS